MVPGCGSRFSVLEQILADKVIPAIFGCEISDKEQMLFSLPAQIGGLGISDPTDRCDLAYSTMRNGCDIVIQENIGLKLFDPDTYMDALNIAKG